MKRFRGESRLLLQPNSVDQISRILKYCNKNMIAVNVQGLIFLLKGGNTGLVGGGVPVFDEVIIQLGKLNSIRSFDDISGVVVCDAGVILENLDNTLSESGY